MQKRLLTGYGAGSLATGIFSTMPGVLLLFYMTDTLAVPAQLASLAIFIPKFWDMVSDPLMGHISDATISRWGRRRPFLFIGSWLMPVCFVGIFLVPDFANPYHSFLYVLGAYILAATAYTIFAVPYMTLPAEMSDNPKIRTKIVAYRMTIALLGILCGAAVAPMAVEAFGGGKGGYLMMALSFGVVCFGSMIITTFTTKFITISEPDTRTKNQNQKLSWIKQVWDLKNNKLFLSLLGTYLFQLIGIGIFTAMMPYFVVYILQEGQDYLGYLFLLSLGTATISMLLWGRLCSWVGKTSAYYVAIGIYGVSLISLFAASYHPIIVEVGMVCLGVGFAGLQVVPYSLLSDVTCYDRDLAPYSREGLLTGVWSACEKTGLAFGPLVAGTMLAYTGYQETADSVDLVRQGTDVVTGILYGISVVPAVFVLISLFFLKNIKIPAAERPVEIATICE